MKKTEIEMVERLKCTSLFLNGSNDLSHQALRGSLNGTHFQNDHDLMFRWTWGYPGSFFFGNHRESRVCLFRLAANVIFVL